VTAPNPGPFTLSGTNTWIVGRGPAWVVDPGPAIEAHLQRLYEEIEARGGLGGVVLTHGHEDHREAVPALLERYPVPLASAGGEASRGGEAGAKDASSGEEMGTEGRASIVLAEGTRIGPFQPVAVPGHSPDSFALIARGACFSGDAVLGQGSVYIAPYPGAMAGYLSALERLQARDDFEVICPGHGPLVEDGHGKIQEYIDHRLERERALRDALGQGLRGERELLDAVWADVPEQLRGAATVVLAAHLDKLAEEGALPEGVGRPAFGKDMHW
jgi:glyoxylase-like metal-dependent hydrolase (beta-lactamase superfamily II)